MKRALIALLLFAGSALAQGTAVVRGRITLGEKRVMSGATVVVEDSLRRRTSATTGKDGKFRMLVSAPGSYQLAVMRVGTTPAVGPQFEVIPEDTIDANVQIPIVESDTAVALDSVRVLGEGSATAKMAEFDGRRRIIGSTTRTILREEIEKRNPVDTWQMLTNVPSIKVAQQGSQVVARSMRMESVKLIGPDRPCYMRVLVDGVLKQEDQFEPDDVKYDGKFPGVHPIATDLSKALPPPNQIQAIEIFAGPATIPPQYGGTGNNKWCGLIAVWTR